jgi:hypothetical protein
LKSVQAQQRQFKKWLWRNNKINAPQDPNGIGERNRQQQRCLVPQATQSTAKLRSRTYLTYLFIFDRYFSENNNNNRNKIKLSNNRKEYLI